MHPFIPVLSPPFLYHPYSPSFKSNSFTCLLSFFFAAHAGHIKFYALSNNILPEAIIVFCTLVVFKCCQNCVTMYMYVRQLLFMLFTNILPEAICCCLQTCTVYGAWVTLYCICVQTFVVTCANIS